MVWGLWTGEYALALPLALFFELFWIDLIPIGSYLPPMPAFSYLVLLCLASSHDWTTPETIAFPIAITLPLAYIIPSMECRQRHYQRIAYSKLVAEARKSRPLGSLPGRLLLVSGLQQLALGTLLFLSTAFILQYAFSWKIMQSVIIPLDVTWTELYVIALIGALLSLRIRRAYAVFAVSMIGVTSLRLFLVP